MENHERRVQKNEKFRDEFRGCLIGGAAGDALGYPVEFMRAREIFSKYGPQGITEYQLAENGKALISDDTQMTMFTATGLLLGQTRGMTRGVGGGSSFYVGCAYHTWFRMQTGQSPRKYDCAYSWLADVPEMGAPRAPGTTCMSVIRSGHYGMIDEPVNKSKGCGGVMRVAPVGLYFNRPTSRQFSIDDMWENAAGTAALTHGHELGWMPAAVLAHIINRVAYSDLLLIDCIREAQEFAAKRYAGRRHLKTLNDIIDLAVKLSRNGENDLENIKMLGEGWVAEETLAIAIYCSLKYQDDFPKALCAAVNHDGDSDSTGAVTGNILGALWGYERIPDKWKQNLECHDVILEVADDLCHDCQIGEYGPVDPVWESKYIENRRVTKAFTMPTDT